MSEFKDVVVEGEWLKLPGGTRVELTHDQVRDRPHRLTVLKDLGRYVLVELKDGNEFKVGMKIRVDPAVLPRHYR